MPSPQVSNSNSQNCSKTTPTATSTPQQFDSVLERRLSLCFLQAVCSLRFRFGRDSPNPVATEVVDASGLLDCGLCTYRPDLMRNESQYTSATVAWLCIIKWKGNEQYGKTLITIPTAATTTTTTRNNKRQKFAQICNCHRVVSLSDCPTVRLSARNQHKTLAS